MKIDIAKILAMSPEDQGLWVSEYCNKEKIDNAKIIPHPDLGFDEYETEISLAELAFRLRDEWAKHGAFYSAMLDVQESLKIEKYTSRRAMSYKFWAMQAQPIHWILATLKAMEAEYGA